MKRFTTPILFVIFNRLDTTKIVFEEIRKIKPNRFFIAADGYIPERTGEKEKCELVKNWVLSNIDWDCEVKTLFQEKNLGCGLAPATAITWFFEQVEEGIILEDDCVPHPDFFYYCAELLEKYRNDDRLAVVGGDNFQEGKTQDDASYYFSKYSYTWGWASWRRVWQNYQFDLNKLDKVVMFQKIDTIFKTNKERQYWKSIFEARLVSNDDAWDYQLWFHVWYHGMCSVAPNVNLVKNIGFSDNATHTTDINSTQAFLETYPILPIIHPPKIKINHRADYDYFIQYWAGSVNKNCISTLVDIVYRFLPPSAIQMYRNIKKNIKR